MKKSAVLVLLATFLLLVSCGKPRLISKSKFVKIYVDMIIADQWLQSNQKYQRQADTTFFYDPIFERYGYTKEDYFATVDYYLRDPDSYIKIMTKVKASVDLKLKEVEAEMDEYQRKSSRHFPDRKVPNFLTQIDETVRRDTLHLALDEKGVYALETIAYDSYFSGPQLVRKGASQRRALSSYMSSRSTVDTVGSLSSKRIRPMPEPKAAPNAQEIMDRINRSKNREMVKSSELFEVSEEKIPFPGNKEEK